MISSTSDRPDVMLVGPLPGPLNGMTVMTASLLRTLESSGWRVLHLNTSDHRGIDNVQRFDLTNVVLALKHGLDALLRIAGERPNLAWLPIAEGELGLFRDALVFGACRLFRTPTVVHFHGAEFSDFYARASRPVRWLIRWCLRDCRLAVALTALTAAKLKATFPGLKIQVAANGVSSPLSMGRSHLQAQTRVLYMSTLMERKGYRELLRAAKLVLAVRQDVQFVFAGAWFGRDELRRGLRLAGESLRPEQILFTGEVSGLRRSSLLQESDVFVFPPIRPEGQGLVLLEAMSHALPIIATDIGAVREVVTPEHDAILVPPGEPERLARAIISLVANPSLRQRLGAAAYSTYENRFTTEHLGRRINQMLREAMSPTSALHRAEH